MARKRGAQSRRQPRATDAEGSAPRRRRSSAAEPRRTTPRPRASAAEREARPPDAPPPRRPAPPPAGRQPALSGVDGGWTSFAVILALAATTLMLEATRVFVAYLVFVVDQSRRVELAVIALGVFGAIGLAGLVRSRLGWQRAIAVGAGGLAAGRLLLQVGEQPELRLVVSALVIICWGWLLVTLLDAVRDAAALGVLLGLALDVAIRIGFETVDLPWMPDAAAHATTIVLLLLVGFGALMLTVLNEPPAGRTPAFSLVAVGPGLAVFHLLTGNIGLVQSLLETTFPRAAIVLTLGLALGLLLAALAASTPSTAGTRAWLRSPRVEGPLSVFILAVIALAGLWLFWQRPGPSGVALVAGIASSLGLLALALLGSEPGRRSPRGGVALWLTAGMVLQVVLLFIYYTYTGPPVVIVVAWALLLVGAFASGTRVSVDPAWRARSLRVWMGAVVFLLAFVSLVKALDWSEPEPGAPLEAELTIVAYNIQAGFSRDNIFDLDAIATTIEAQEPDVVILQEVSRGWLVMAGIDQVDWLSQRLGMPAYFGAASDDGLWGNVVLTRAPVGDELRRKFASTENLKRSTIGVQVETVAGPLWVFGTHLDNPSGAGEARMEQVGELLAAWDGRAPAVIAGDFNADPDSDVIVRMLDAGFDDTGVDLPAEVFTSEDRRRIDYVFTTTDLEVTDITIPEVWTSDHLPVVATLVMP